MADPQRLANQQPTFEELLDWLEGRLSKADTATVAAQVAAVNPSAVADRSTQDAADWIRAFLRVREAVVWEAPPSHVRRALTQEFAVYAQQQAADRVADGAQPGLWERILATLTFDSGLQPALGGVRGGRPAARQLIYSTPAAEIALNVEQSTPHSGFFLSGQILPTDDVRPDAFAVKLQLCIDDHNVDSKGETTADEFGEFAFDQLMPGNYSLILTADPLVILLSSVNIDDPALHS